MALGMPSDGKDGNAGSPGLLLMLLAALLARVLRLLALLFSPSRNAACMRAMAATAPFKPAPASITLTLAKGDTSTPPLAVVKLPALLPAGAAAAVSRCLLLLLKLPQGLGVLMPLGLLAGELLGVLYALLLTDAAATASAGA